MTLRFLAIAFILLLPSKSFADNLTIGLGGLTSHPLQVNRGMNFCNQIGATGVIGNRSLYIRYGRGRWNATALFGEDSICSKVLGLFGSRQMWEGKYWVAGLIGGLYTFKREDWANWYRQTKDRNKAPYPFHIKMGSNGLIPVVGVEYNIRLYETKNSSIWLNNLISIPITNHSLAYVYYF